MRHSRFASLGGWAVTLPLTFFGLLLVTFLIGRVVPIDPVLAIVGDRASQDVYERVRNELGLGHVEVSEHERAAVHPDQDRAGRLRGPIDPEPEGVTRGLEAHFAKLHCSALPAREPTVGNLFTILKDTCRCLDTPRP